MASKTKRWCDGCSIEQRDSEFLDWKHLLHGASYLDVCPACWKIMVAALLAIAEKRKAAT